MIIPSIQEDASRLVQQAMQSNNSAAQTNILNTGFQILEMLLNKNEDYGNSVFNVPLLLPNEDPTNIILVRISDKISRLVKLATTREHRVEESFDDSLKDLAGYIILYLTSRQ